MSPYKLVRYVLDPNGREWIPVETVIKDAAHLEQELRAVMAGPPTVVDFLAPNGDAMNLGLGGPVAYVAFASAEMLREGRTVSAAGTVDESVPEWVEFEMGGTPTPINRDGLVYAEQLLAITKHYLERGDLHPDFDWE
jgi:hypothetical protein